MSAKNVLHVVIITGMMLFGGSTIFAQSTKASDSENTPKKQLLFFMNPNGRPCRMQDTILKKMGTALSDVVTLRYIKTTDRADYPTFRTYGIRGLPLLIILDENGKELKRFTPGVQSTETILNGVNVKKLGSRSKHD